MVTSQAGQADNFLHPSDVLHRDISEDNPAQMCLYPPEDEKTTRNDDYDVKTTSNGGDDDLTQTGMAKCVLNLVSKMCEIHDCVLMETKISVLKWCYQPSKKCYGNVRKRVTRWICCGGRGSCPVLQSSQENRFQDSK